MPHFFELVCMNCGSNKHRKCCPRCGALVRKASDHSDFCSRRCLKLQLEADRISAEMEEDATS